MYEPILLGYLAEPRFKPGLVFLDPKDGHVYKVLRLFPGKNKDVFFEYCDSDISKRTLQGFPSMRTLGCLPLFESEVTDVGTN